MLDAKCVFKCPHRHFSHLLQVWNLPDPAVTPAQMALSLDHWYGITCNRSNVFNEECRGFTHCGIVGMNVMVGRADAAAGNLTDLVDTLITPNAMYGEEVFANSPWEFSPVAESAYCGAAGVHEMLLSPRPSDPAVLRVLPGVPASWRDLAFHDLQAAGGLRLSLQRSNGTLQFVRVALGPAGTATLDVADWANATTRIAWVPAAARVQAAGPGTWTVAGAAEVILYPAARPAGPFVVAPLPGNASEFNWFGLRRAPSLLH